jgi:hypothetical protein
MAVCPGRIEPPRLARSLLHFYGENDPSQGRIMNSDFLAMLIAIGIGVVSGVQADIATETSDGQRQLSTIDAGRSIYRLEYIDAPTDAWRQRLELYRLA